MEKTRTVEVNRFCLHKGVVKDKNAEDVIILEFIDRFHWLFADMNQQVVYATLQVS